MGVIEGARGTGGLAYLSGHITGLQAPRSAPDKHGHDDDGTMYLL